MVGRYPLSLRSILGICRHRYLIYELSKRDVLGRYKGSYLGLFWTLVHPLIMLCVYTFVFSVIFQAKWNEAVNDRGNFALILFCGLIVFGYFAETVNRAPGLVLNNPVYVKKVVFPLEILPVVTITANAFHLVASFLILLAFSLIWVHGVPWTIVLFPVVLIPLTLFSLGVTWFLASLGVFIRDIGYFVTIVTTILMFLSPLFYPLSAVPEAFRPILMLNPLSNTIEQARRVAIWGTSPDWLILGIETAVALGVCWLGYVWFQKTRKGFADVI